MEKLTFNSNLISKKLLSSLDERPRRVLEERFGLVSSRKRTLESVGQEYGITRERVRQIESFALNKLRQAEVFTQLTDIFNELKDHINKKGGIVKEWDFLSSLSKKDQDQNYLYFLLVAGEPFERLKEDENFHHAWTIDLDRASSIKEALIRLHQELGMEDLYSEKEIISAFENHLKAVFRKQLEEEIILSLLRISRVLEPNSLGEWGMASSSRVRPRGMRDYSFLIMRKHGSPMHFSEVAKAIEGAFGRPAHVQTVHNELIKDPRFVLVGRGLYALKEWGYEGGVVRDVIIKILKTQGALSKDDIIKKVMKERYVKENTILVNLQNNNYFKKDSRGNFTLL